MYTAFRDRAEHIKKLGRPFEGSKPEVGALRIHPEQNARRILDDSARRPVAGYQDLSRYGGGGRRVVESLRADRLRALTPSCGDHKNASSTVASHGHHAQPGCLWGA